MAFDYRAIITRALVAPFFDTAPPPYEELLQIKVDRAEVPDGQLRWEAICGYILSPKEGGGNPNVYLSAVNQDGTVEHQQTTGHMMTFGWDWEGRRPNQKHDPVKGDKPLNEPSANINMGKGQICEVWVIDDAIPSDKVYNLRSDHPGALYHTSSFVCFKLSTGTTQPPPKPEPEPEPPGEDCADLQERVDEAIVLLEVALAKLKGSAS